MVERQLTEALVLPRSRPRDRIRRAAFWHWARRYPTGLAGLVMVIALLLLAAGAGVIATHEPIDATAPANLDPGPAHYLGTDPVGKDIYSLLLHGARISLSVAVAAVALGVTGGALFGLVTGYTGGPLDLLGQRLVDALVAFPAIIKALVLMAILGPSPTNVVIALAISYIPQWPGSPARWCSGRRSGCTPRRPGPSAPPQAG